MRYGWIKNILIIGFFIIGLAFGLQKSFALSAGDAVPIQDGSAIIKIGQIAPNLVLPVAEEQDGNLDFKVGLPTVILSVRSTEDIEKLMEFEKIYKEYQDRIRLYVITGGNREDVNKLFKKNSLTMPIIIDSTIHFIRKYNNGVPTMMITTGDGKVVYNSSFFIEMNSLKRYIDKLLEGNELLPSMTFVPPVIRHFEPKTMKIGTVIAKDKFKDLDENDMVINYLGKPTVLLFWMDFSMRETLEKEMSVLEQLYIKNRDKVNFYTMVNTPKKDFVLKVLNEHHCTVQTVVSQGNALNYTLGFPSMVVIDSQGVLRYRPVSSNVEELQRILDECQTPYKPLPEPKTAEEWLKRGDSLLVQHNNIEAFDAYNRCLELDPKFYLAYVKRGAASRQHYKMQQAYDDYSKAIELNPKEISNYYCRAEIAKDLRKFSQMLDDYAQIIAFDTKETKAYLYRGNYYLQNNKPDMAINNYTKVVEYAPNYVEGYIKRGDAYFAMKNYAEAMHDYNHAVELNPHEAAGYYGRGILHFVQQQYEQAVNEFSSAIAAQPAARFYYARGSAYFKQGRSDLTILDFTKLIELEPKEGYAYYQRGIVHRYRNEYKEAIDDLTKAMYFYPRNGEMAFALAQCFEVNQEQDRALNAYKIALEYLSQMEKTKLAKAQSRVDGDWDSYSEWIQ